jgi:hypothetical protein
MRSRPTTVTRLTPMRPEGPKPKSLRQTQAGSINAAINLARWLPKEPSEAKRVEPASALLLSTA